MLHVVVCGVGFWFFRLGDRALRDRIAELPSLDTPRDHNNEREREGGNTPDKGSVAVGEVAIKPGREECGGDRGGDQRPRSGQIG